MPLFKWREMLKQTFGTKQVMTEAYLGEGRVVVTKIQVPDLKISQIKTQDKDGYEAIQVSFGESKKHPSKALKGHFKALKEVPKTTREIRKQFIKEEADFKVGDTITPSQVFEVGDILSIQGTTKGKGFAGVVKRWGFGGGPRTHGQSDRLRAPGSIGQGTSPGRVHKGKKMPGRHGSLTRSVKNSQIIYIDQEKGEIWVTGHVPGNKYGTVTLTILNHKDLVEKPFSPEIIIPKEEVKTDPSPENQTQEESSDNNQEEVTTAPEESQKDLAGQAQKPAEEKKDTE